MTDTSRTFRPLTRRTFVAGLAASLAGCATTTPKEVLTLPTARSEKYAAIVVDASTGRTLFSSGTGFAAAFLGWTWFFIGTSLTAVPALLLMVWLERRGHFRTLETQRNGR